MGQIEAQTAQALTHLALELFGQGCWKFPV